MNYTVVAQKYTQTMKYFGAYVQYRRYRPNPSFNSINSPEGKCACYLFLKAELDALAFLTSDKSEIKEMRILILMRFINVIRILHCASLSSK